MLVQKYRPLNFDNLIGAEFPKLVLKKILKDPVNSPKSLIFYGASGTGKTSAARIFGRAINCKKKDKNMNPCLKCDYCKDINTAGNSFYEGNYFEFDSSIIGNVETIKEFKEIFYHSFENSYKTIVFDECHLFSKQAMSVLLKILEDSENNNFFIFCTTDLEKVLETIISRSLLIQFKKVSKKELEALLKKIVTSEKINLSKETYDRIIYRSNGSIRNLIQLIELVRIAGENNFLNSNVFLSGNDFNKLFDCYFKEDFTEAQKQLNYILSQPLELLRQDFEAYIKRLAFKCFVEKKISNKFFKSLVTLYFKHSNYIQSTNDWYVFFCGVGTLIEKKKREYDYNKRFTATESNLQEEA